MRRRFHGVGRWRSGGTAVSGSVLNCLSMRRWFLYRARARPRALRARAYHFHSSLIPEETQRQWQQPPIAPSLRHIQWMLQARLDVHEFGSLLQRLRHLPPVPPASMNVVRDYDANLLQAGFLSTISRLESHLSAVQVADVILACRTVRVQLPSRLKLLLLGRVRGQCSRLEPTQLCELIDCFRDSGSVVDRALFEELASAAAAVVDRLLPHDLTRSLFVCSKLRMPNVLLFRRAQEIALVSLDAYQLYDLRQLAWALAKGCAELANPALLSAIDTRFANHHKTPTTVDFSMTLWAFAVLRHPVSSAFLGRLEHAFGQFRAVDLPLVAWSLSRLYRQPLQRQANGAVLARLFTAIEATCLPSVGVLIARNLCTLAWSLHSSDAGSLQFFDLVRSAALHRLPSLGARDVAQLYDVFGPSRAAILDVTELLQALAARSKQLTPQLDERHLANLLNGARRSGVASPDAIAALLARAEALLKPQPQQTQRPRRQQQQQQQHVCALIREVCQLEPPEPNILRVVLEHVERQPNATAFVHVVDALSRAPPSPTDAPFSTTSSVRLLRAAVPRLIGSAARYTAFEVSSLMRSLSRINIVHAEFFAAVVQLRPQPFTLEGAVYVLESFANVGLAAEPFATRAAQQFRTVDYEFGSRFLLALARVDSPAPAESQAAIFASMMRDAAWTQPKLERSSARYNNVVHRLHLWRWWLHSTRLKLDPIALDPHNVLATSLDAFCTHNMRPVEPEQLSATRDVAECLASCGVTDIISPFRCPQTGLAVDVAVPTRRFLITILYPNMYVSLTKRLTGHAQLRQRILRSVGWNVHHLPLRKWVTLTTDVERRRYLGNYFISHLTRLRKIPLPSPPKSEE